MLTKRHIMFYNDLSGVEIILEPDCAEFVVIRLTLRFRERENFWWFILKHIILLELQIFQKNYILFKIILEMFKISHTSTSIFL